MYNLGNLQDRFDWSYMQARNRVKWLQDSSLGEVKIGKNQKYLVTEAGFSMLDRLHQLEEENNLSLNTAKKQVKAEMEDNQPEGSIKRGNSGIKTQSKSIQSDTNHHGNGRQSDEKYVKQLERENKFLRKELEQKNRQIQQLLPAAKGREKPEATPWELFKNWLFKPR